MNSKRTSATVLVVDDQEILTRLMCKTLESHDCRVLWANNGQDALNLPTNAAPSTLFRGAEPPVDLLVTDYEMPGMNGLELAHECCALDPNLSVLYISGSSPGIELAAELRLENRAFLAKPFRQSDLMQSAKALLEAPTNTYSSGSSHGSQLLSMAR